MSMNGLTDEFGYDLFLGMEWGAAGGAVGVIGTIYSHSQPFAIETTISHESHPN